MFSTRRDRCSEVYYTSVVICFSLDVTLSLMRLKWFLSVLIVSELVSQYEEFSLVFSWQFYFFPIPARKEKAGSVELRITSSGHWINSVLSQVITVSHIWGKKMIHLQIFLHDDTQGQKGKSTGVCSALADAAVWVSSIMPWLVGCLWLCLRGAWTASSPCWQSSGSSRGRLYPKSYSGLKLLKLYLS